MNGRNERAEDQPGDPAEKLFSGIAPYLSDPGTVTKMIGEAFRSSDPADYLMKEMEKGSGSLRIDLKIAINKMKKDTMTK